jgi:hypothetical protein
MGYFVLPLTGIALVLPLIFAWSRQYLKPRRLRRKELQEQTRARNE